MITYISHGFTFRDGAFHPAPEPYSENKKRTLKYRTMAGQVLLAHEVGHHGDDILHLKFDALTSPDNNYVSILSTLRAVGVSSFPLPWILSNCHNSLCSISGTQNADDHKFGALAAQKYGAIFLPPYLGVIHQYIRETVASPGKMVLGSDSHTRYGPLGTLGFGEGGGEIANHLMGHPYPLSFPKIIAVHLTGKLHPGVGPMDVALSLIKETYSKGLLKNAILEFHGEGLHNLTMDERFGIDVMTTEASALSSIWAVDHLTQRYLADRGRNESFQVLTPSPDAYYDALVELPLDQIRPMIALPPHPGNVYEISHLLAHGQDIFRKLDEQHVIPGFHFISKLEGTNIRIDQGLVTGCAGGSFENIRELRDILQTGIEKSSMRLQVSPASTQISAALMETGITRDLLELGVPLGLSICGGCFGVSDIPADHELSARHVTRNFPMREGAKKEKGQSCATVLMDTRSIAATYKNGGFLTPGTSLSYAKSDVKESYHPAIYENSVLNFYNHPKPEIEIKLGPGISDWPDFSPLKNHLLLKVSYYSPKDITTDDLLPSGEVSALRSHPKELANYTLMNIDAAYARRAVAYLEEIQAIPLPVTMDKNQISFGTVIVTQTMGDGSSREQAVSSQRILGGLGNIASSYATQRYLRNMVNYGVLPLLHEHPERFQEGTLLYFSDIRESILNGNSIVSAITLLTGEHHTFSLPSLSPRERALLLAGGLISYEKNTLHLDQNEKTR